MISFEFRVLDCTVESLAYFIWPITIECSRHVVTWLRKELGEILRRRNSIVVNSCDTIIEFGGMLVRFHGFSHGEISFWTFILF